MKSLKTIKWALVAAWVLGVMLLMGSMALFNSTTASTQKKPPPPSKSAAQPGDYVGEDTCTDCHTEQAKHYSDTAHAKLKKDSSWKGKVVGCESCHGAGKAHVETMSEAIGNGVEPDTIKDKKIIYYQ